MLLPGATKPVRASLIFPHGAKSKAKDVQLISRQPRGCLCARRCAVLSERVVLRGVWYGQGVCCYVLSGTDAAYRARLQVLGDHALPTVSPAIGLRAPYEMPGISLRAAYAVSGTDPAYGGCYQAGITIVALTGTRQSCVITWAVQCGHMGLSCLVTWQHCSHVGSVWSRGQYYLVTWVCPVWSHGQYYEVT
eukprot:21777-Rhodomonas_salina.2